MKLSNWVEIWVTSYKEPYLKKSGLDCLNYSLKHIIGVFGDRELETIKGYEVQQFLVSLNDIPNMQHKVKVYFNELLEYAYRNDLISKNPMLAIKFRPKTKIHRQAMSLEEELLFINGLENKKYKLLFLTYLFTGARRNEVISLNAINFDFNNNIVFINGTKTKSSVRTLPLILLLKNEILKINDWKNYYTSFNSDYVTRKVHRYALSIGLENVCVHSLRTTFATRCLESGVSPKMLQLWLGHSKIDTTLDIYCDGRVLGDKGNMLHLQESQKMEDYIKKELKISPFWSG